MPSRDIRELSKREREVLYLVYQHHPASVHKIQENMQSEVSYNGVRRILDSLVSKKLVHSTKVGKKYQYSPVRSAMEQGTQMLKEVLMVFFDESAALGFASLMKSKDARLQELEIENLRSLLSEEASPDST